MGKVLHQSGNITEWKAGGPKYVRTPRNSLRLQGSAAEWKAGGPKYVRTALWQYVKTIIIIHRKPRGQSADFLRTLEKQHHQPETKPWLNQPLIAALAKAQSIPEAVASLRLHYKFTADNKRGDRRVSATTGRFCRMLYKALVREFAAKTKG